MEGVLFTFSKVWLAPISQTFLIFFNLYTHMHMHNITSVFMRVFSWSTNIKVIGVLVLVKGYKNYLKF